MPTDAIVGFWSYAHHDNEADSGGILALAQLISDEFALLSGQQLTLFIDRNDIAWGEVWRERINSTLSQTIFFIPVITPLYFRRPECRRELLEFAAKAMSLGVYELLLPILYAKPADFSEESTDQAVVLVAGTQYVDWQNYRLMEPNSREFRKALNTLATRLLDIANRVEEHQLQQEFQADPESDGVAGITELVECITELLPEWHDAVMGYRVIRDQTDATWNQCFGQVEKLQRSHAPASAVAAAQIRTAKEMLPLIERNTRHAEVYVARSIQLDPHISSLASLIDEHPESYDLILPIRESIDEAIANIDEWDARVAVAMAKGSTSRSDLFSKWRHLGRIFHRCVAIWGRSERLVDEGNAIVRRWDIELTRPAVSTDQILFLGQGD